jgi:CHAT domain-containing protein
MKPFLSFLFLMLLQNILFSQNYAQLSNEASKYSNIDNEKYLYYTKLAAAQAAAEFGAHSRQYAESLNTLAEANRNKDNLQETEKYLLAAHRILKDSLFNSDENGVNLIALGKYYHQIGDYTEANVWFGQFINFAEQTSSECKGGFAYLGDFFYDMGDFKKAKHFLEKNVTQCEFLAEKSPLEYAFRIEKLANLYNDNGDYVATEQLYARCFPIFKKYIPQEHPEWAYIQANYLNFLIKIKNFSAANVVIEELFKIPYTKSSVEVMAQIAEAFVQMEKYNDAEVFYNYAHQLCAQQSVKSYCEDIKLLNNIGNVQLKLANYAKADDYLSTASKLLDKKDILNKITLKQADDGEKNLYINVLISTAILENARKNHQQAINYCKKAWKTVQYTAKIDEERRRNILSQLIIAYDALDDYTSLESMIALDINETSQNQITRILPAVGSLSRVSFLIKIAKYNHIVASILTRSHTKMQNSGSLLYDYALHNKGIGLQWNLNERSKMRQSKDSLVIFTYKKWQNLYSKLVSLSENSREYQEIRQIMDEIERSFSQRLGVSERYFAQIDWQKIRAALNPNDLAIEIVALPYYDVAAEKYNGDTLYFAAILDFNASKPQLLYLFEQKELQKLLENGDDFYNDPAAYALVWEKIAPFTRNINTIYFSPAGLLYQIKIGAIPTPRNQRLIDLFKFQTLLSTRNLLEQSNLNVNIKNGETLIFAGADYDDYSNEAQFFAFNYEKKPIDVVDNDATEGYKTNPKNYKKLPYSYDEGNKIFSICIEKNLTVRHFTSIYATEQHLKNAIRLEEKSPFALIISTHGFFDTNHEPHKTNPMNRCGLVMAGANRLLKNNAFASNDGILLGQEIQQIDLSGTKIVILPTCESANGEISTSEGVFGLQRAFKLAGAEYILMYLDSAEDRVTNEFMISFYEKLAAEKSISDAFYETQIAIRKQYPNRLDWANWVLIK